jgi:hypothetical protein
LDRRQEDIASTHSVGAAFVFELDADGAKGRHDALHPTAKKWGRIDLP